VCAAKANGEDESGNPLKLKGLYKKFGDGYKNGRAPEPRAEAAADELNNPLELRLLLFLLELLLDFPELFDLLSLELLSLSFLSDGKLVPLILFELGVSPGKLKLGKPNRGLANPIPAKPPNGKNSGGALPEDEVVVVEAAEVVELEVVFDEGVVDAAEDVVEPAVGSINIFIEGKPAANILALKPKEFKAAEDGKFNPLEVTAVFPNAFP
jgi:hypothetical protein